MRLDRLLIKNFRSCEDVQLVLSGDITVLVGENASGKSAIIDALRLVTISALERGGISYSAASDPTFGMDTSHDVEIVARYTDLSESQKAVFMTELVDEHEDLVYRNTLTRDSDKPYWQTGHFTVGDAVIEDPEPLNRRRIAHVYLPPLRDAVRELDSGGGERLAEVLRVLTAGKDGDRTTFRDAANARLAEIANLELPSTAREEIQRHLTGMTPPTRRHEVRLAGREHELRRLAGLMRMQLADSQIDPMELASSGLGYASLLYIAMIVVQLSNAKNYDLTLLLVEEPEAHLHPQLQSVLLDYLRTQARMSQATGSATGSLDPVGRIQVIVSTHSPNLTSAVSVKEIAVVARTSGFGSKEEVAQPEDAVESGRTAATSGQVWRTSTTSLATLDLKPADIRKLDRYLTATRSSLLFARHVFLVEGVAESVLVPVFAKHSQEPQGDTVLRHLASCSFVAIDGVDFEPYLNLLLLGSHPRLEKVVVITDGDVTKAGESQGQARKERYEKLYKAAVNAGRLSVYVGDTTLEADLFAEGVNEPVLKKAYLAMHPSSEDKWDAVSSPGASAVERARDFSAAIKAKTGSLDLGKGDFAQLIAEAFEDDQIDTDGFIIPAHITSAISWICADVAVPDAIEGVEHVKSR